MSTGITRNQAGQMFHKVLLRNASDRGNPEVKLCAAVIAQAFYDELKGDADGKRFFNDGRLDGFADAVGMSPFAVRSLARAAKSAIR